MMEGKIKPNFKLIVIIILLIISCFLTYYASVVIQTDIIFTHFFYIPIILASFWWKKKGLLVTLFLIILLFFNTLFFNLDWMIIQKPATILFFRSEQCLFMNSNASSARNTWKSSFLEQMTIKCKWNAPIVVVRRWSVSSAPPTTAWAAATQNPVHPPNHELAVVVHAPHGTCRDIELVRP